MGHAIARSSEHRSRLDVTYATAKAAWRARRKARGGAPASMFERGRFVAVDGEGFSDGDLVSLTIGAKDTLYEARDHRYALLMDSDGGEVWAPEGRLRAKQCLDFLLAITIRDRNAIPVIFSGGYDVCHMLAFELGRDDILQLLRGGDLSGRRYLDITLSDGDGAHDYRIECRPRKSLTVWRFAAGADKYRRHERRDGGAEWKLAPEARVCLWDCWGFFQGTFIDAMNNWIPGDPDQEFVAAMKGERSTFDRSDIATIRRYTAAELRCLVLMMERVRTAMRALGLTLNRWDGAGAIAKAMFRANDVKSHLGKSPDHIVDAARVAYAGGHIEACQLGYHPGKVYHYDINSAYPSWFIRLPSLAAGDWHGGDPSEDGLAPPAGFTLVRIEYHFKAGLPFYPLFWRAPSGAILYPERGSGWYWYPEFSAAEKFASLHGAYDFRVVEWHTWVGTANALPFGWIAAAYQVRRDVIMRSRATGVRDDSHLMIRLGLNSCYGATAQQVGARFDFDTGEIVPPTYFQLEWAGYVTSGCRAQLIEAATPNPWAIISFATDAIFSTEPLDLPCDPVKRLGEWEAHTHDNGMSIVMPGVYWLHDADSITHHSRGFDKKTLSDPEMVHRAWARGDETIAVTQRRMITLGSALMSENFWTLRGLFVSTERELKLNGFNSKRHPVANLRAKAAHRQLVRTVPRELTEDAGQSLASLMSAPYPIAWLDGEPGAIVGGDDVDEGAAAFFVTDREAGDLGAGKGDGGFFV